MKYFPVIASLFAIIYLFNSYDSTEDSYLSKTLKDKEREIERLEMELRLTKNELGKCPLILDSFLKQYFDGRMIEYKKEIEKSINTKIQEK